MTTDVIVKLLGEDFDGDEVSKLIIGYEANAINAEDNFKKLMQVAISNNCRNGDEFAAVLLPGEVKVLEAREKYGQRVRTKDGKWLISKVCSTSTYSSNKSVICKALDAGVPLTTDLGTTAGKTAIEKALKNKSTPKTPDEKLVIAWKTFKKLYPQCDKDTQDLAKRAIRHFLDTEA